MNKKSLGEKNEPTFLHCKQKYKRNQDVRQLENYSEMRRMKKKINVRTNK